MDEPRLPAHLEVAALIRRVQAAGGFAAVLRKGEREAGTIFVVVYESGGKSRAYERMPQSDGARTWQLARSQNTENKEDFNEYVSRRGDQDGDLWIIELDIAQAERLIGLPARES